MIGKTITGYNPTFNAKADVQGGTITGGKYIPKDEYTGFKIDEYVPEQGTFDTEDLGWRIWGIDADNIYLISAKPTTTCLALGGAQGYNNGVGALNEICKTCYTDSSYKNVSVRSMNIRDIEKLYDNSRGIMTYDYKNYYSSYNNDTRDRYDSSKTFPWPTRYIDNDSQDTAAPFNKRNEEGELIESTNATKTGEEVTEEQRKPYMSLWERGSYLDFAKTEEAQAYASMIFSYVTGDFLPGYWLATRSVFPYGICYFGLQIVNAGEVSYGNMYYRDVELFEGSLNWMVRPLVSIPLTSCTISGPTEKGEYTIEKK